MKKNFLLLVLLWSFPAFASIAYVSGTTAGAGCTTAGVTGSGTCPATYSPTTGNAVALFYRTQTSPVTPYAQDNNLHTMMQGAGVTLNTGYLVRSFAALAQSGTTSYAVTGLSTSNSIVLGEYSGVLAFNLNPTLTGCSGTLANNQCSGTSTSPTVTFTLDDANDYAVCAFTQAAPNGGGTWQAPYTGTLRQSYTSTPTMVLVDTTAATATSVTIGASLASSSAWKTTCIELRTVLPANTIGTVLQISPPGYGGLTGPATCTVTSPNCDWDFAPTTAGTLLVFPFSDHSDFNNAQRSVVTLITCSIKTGGICDGIHGTVDTVTFPRGNCQAYVQDSQPESDSEEMGYVLAGGGGAIHATAVRSGANPTSERQGYGFTEIAPPAGSTFAFDACGPASIATGATSFNITGVALSGTNEAIVQGITGGTAPMLITSPYLQGESIPQHQGFWVGLGLNSGAAPTISSATGVNGAAGVAIAFKLVGPPAPAGIIATGGIAALGGIAATQGFSSIAITTTSPLPNCTISTPFTFNFNASGGVAPYTWSLFSGGLQPGLSLSSAGLLSGTCTNSSGTVSFMVQVCDSESTPACTTGSFQQTAQNSPPPTIQICDSTSSPTCPNPPSTGIVGTFYSYNFSAIGGTPPYSWSISSGSLPLGLSLTSAGAFSGFPSTLGTYSFTAEVTDSLAATGAASFTVSIAGFSGNPSVAREPQSWVTAYQGGQNLTTGNPCAITDASGTCARNLPKLCTSGNNCKHEQLGFGTNDHPATLAGLYQAGCDWTQLGQGNYLWVEVKKTSVLTGSAPYTNSLFGNPAALWVAPVKMAGLSTPMLSGLSACPAATSTPIGPWTIPGSVVGSVQFVLGEQVQQATTFAQANLLYVTCANGTGTNAPWRNPGSTVLPSCADAGDSQTGPFSIGMTTGSTPPDSSDEWIGLTSGAVFMPSGAPAANGYFRLTTECDDADTNIPCSGLADQVPCYHSILDSGFVNNPLCSNDLPSMFTIEASTIAVNNSNQVEQDGENTSLSGFEVTIQQGQNQSLPGPACPAGVNCGFSPQLISVDCGSCGQDHVWAHGWDPGDPALHAGDPSQLSFSTTHYPVTPGTSPAQYNCPGWAYFSTQPPSASNPPIALSASASAPYNQIQFANGCGDDIQGGIVFNTGGYGWTEYVAVTKVHKNNTETHTIIMGNAAENLNPNGAGINGPYKIAQVYSCGASEHLFVGGTPANPISGIAMNLELRGYRAGCNPAYRYLTGSSGHSPLASGGFGCGAGTGAVPNLCPEVWAAKKNLELKWCIQCLVDGIILEMMYPDGQTGEIATMDVRVVSGGDDAFIAGPTGIPLTATNDITISNFIMRMSSGGLTVAPRSGGPGDGGGVSQGQNRVHFVNGLIYNLDQNQMGGSKGGDALNWGTSGNSFSGGVATRTSNIASISFPVGTVAPNPLSHIQTCATGPCPGPGSVSIPTGTLYVNFNGQREDPISPQTCVGGACSPSLTGPCLSPDNVTVIPCGTVVFSGGTYDATWLTLTGANVSSTGPIATATADGDGCGYLVGEHVTPVQGSNSSGTLTVATLTHPGAGGCPSDGVPATYNVLSGGSAYHNQASGVPLTTAGMGSGATVGLTVTGTAIPTFDCRSLPCLNTQGTTNIWAPMCNAGIGATSMEIGEGCNNCGASGNSPCPPIGCGDVSCVTGAPLSSDTVCNGTGGAVGPPPGCGPANSTFQTYAFSILDISPGDIAYVTNCSDSTFNTPLAGTPNAYACTAGVNGCTQNQNPVSLTVLYPNTGANVASGVTGCQISNAPSWQRNFIADHIAVITGGQAQLNATLFGIKTQQENNQLTNSVFYFGASGKGLYCSGNPCTNGEASNPGAGHYSPYQTFDQTTNQIHHNAFMLPTTLRTSYYRAVGLLGSTICANDPIPGNCGGSASQVLTPFCTGATQNTDTNGNPLCMGMTGWLSKSSFPSSTYNGTDCTDPVIANCPLTSPPWGTFDYHSFALCPSCASGSQPNLFSTMGSDGLQLGPCLANSSTNCTNAALGTSMISIDNALTRHVYKCIGTCGTGPWPD